jgi:hypothetical protein
MENLTKLFSNSLDLMLYSDDKCIRTFTSFIVYKLLDKKYNLNITPEIQREIVEKKNNNKIIITNLDYLIQCHDTLNDYIVKTNDITLQLLLIFIIQLLMKNKYKLSLAFDFMKKIMLIKLEIIERYKIHRVLFEAGSTNHVNYFILKIINKTKLLF